MEENFDSSKRNEPAASSGEEQPAVNKAVRRADVPHPRDMEKFSRDYEARNDKSTKEAKRKFWIKTLLMLLLIGISVGVMFTITLLFEGKGFGEIKFSWIWLLALLGVELVMLANESMKYAYLLRISTGKWRPKNAIKVMFLGKYYDGITPLGTGGQPFQIYYLHKRNVPAGAASAVPLVRYIVSTIVFCIAAIGLFITSYFVLPDSSTGTAVMIISWISMFANLAIPVILVFASLFPRAGKKLVVKLVAFLAKIHIVKRKYEVTKKYVREMDEYRHALKFLLSSFVKLLPLVLFSIVEVVCYVLLPFTVILMISGTAPTWEIFIQIACMSMLSYYSSSLIPTPGSTIANEAMTGAIFIGMSQPGIAEVGGWATILWRFAFYYIYILSGIGINIFEVIRSAVRTRRSLKEAKQTEAPMSETLPPDSDQT